MGWRRERRSYPVTGPRSTQRIRVGGLLDNCVSTFSEISEANMADYIKLRGDGAFNGFRIYPSPPGFLDPGGNSLDKNDIERNRLGLSHDGERVVREAMLKGMIVNLDHVSSETRRDMRKETGGFFGVRVGLLDARDDVMGSVTTGVAANCPGTATETAKILAYL